MARQWQQTRNTRQQNKINRQQIQKLDKLEDRIKETSSTARYIDQAVAWVPAGRMTSVEQAEVAAWQARAARQNRNRRHSLNVELERQRRP